nr:hypothetical protein [Bradyrhizobium sp. Cp5.3]
MRAHIFHSGAVQEVFAASKDVLTEINLSTGRDWHNDMSKLILDINDRIEAAADDRSRGVIVRKLRKALEGV